MLKVLCSGLCVALFCLPASAHTFEIDSVTVPGACVVSDYANRSSMPWGNRGPNLIRQDGLQKRSILVLPSKMGEALTEAEQAALARCVRSSGRSIGTSNTQRSGRGEEELTQRINACLGNANVELHVQFSTIRLETIRCPQGTINQ